MKKIRSYFILIIAAAIFSGCSGLNKMKQNADQVRYEVSPEILETHAGEVDVTIEGTFPEKYFDEKTILEATPVLVYDGGETQLEKITLQGEDVQANNEVIQSSGDNFTYTSSVSYGEAMHRSELMLRLTATRKNKSVDFEPVKLADGIIATSTLVKTEAMPIAMADKFQRIKPDQQMADIHYLINRAYIRNEELKAEDLQKLEDYLDTVEASEDLEFVDLLVSAYASPDGPLDFNDKLSEDRLESARKYIIQELKKAEIGVVDEEGFIKAETTAEDWEGFKEEVQNSNITNKDLILRVLSMYSDPAVREQEIRNMSEAFEELKDDILPELRRSKFIVNVNKIGRSDQEILEQINSDPSVLDLEELLYAATLTDDLDEKLKYYRIAARQHPQCMRAHNNIGYVLLKQGNVDEAKNAFEDASEIADNDVVKNNLGFVALMNGNKDEAESYFNSMSGSTSESEYGLGTIAIMDGEYDKAVNYFGNEASYNNALAHVLKGDLTKAKNMLDNMTMTEGGYPSYLKAIIGARMDNSNYMLENLREAVNYNADWKEFAAEDLEFANFLNDSEFTAIVE